MNLMENNSTASRKKLNNNFFIRFSLKIKQGYICYEAFYW